MKTNKVLAYIMAVVLLIGVCSGCGTDSNKTKSDNKKISIVCTIFPQYDWVKEIIKGQESRFEVTLLQINGTDLHNYQPTAEDMIKISSGDMFIHIGGESDGWVEDALKEAVNKDMKVIDLMETLGEAVKEEEVVEGMEVHHHDEPDEEEHHEEETHDDEEETKHHHEEETHDDEEETKHHHEEGETGDDEHIWLSLKNTKLLVDKISNAIEESDPKYAKEYEKNSEDYMESLDTLDKQYEEAVDGAEKKTILFADRFPFRYLVDDYGLQYYAAFAGCSAETEASFETIAFLAKKIDELQLSSVLVLENSDKKVAESVVNNTKNRHMEILVLDSLQSVSKEDIETGVTTYLSVMTKNLEVLQDVLQSRL